jgi:hypothetical protein
MPLSANERSQRATIAALARVAQEPSGTAMTDRARRTFRASFYESTDSSLPEAERQRQADAAYKLHMTRLSHRAARSRKRAQAATAEAIDAQADVIAARGDAV